MLVCLQTLSQTHVYEQGSHFDKENGASYMFGGVLVSVRDTFTAVMLCFLHKFSHLASLRWSSHVERLLLRSVVQRHAPPPPLPLAPSGPGTPLGPGQTHLTRPGAWPRGAQGLEWPHLTGTDDSEQEWSTFGGEFQTDNSGSEAGKPGWGRGAGDRARATPRLGAPSRSVMSSSGHCGHSLSILRASVLSLQPKHNQFTLTHTLQCCQHKAGHKVGR